MDKAVEYPAREGPGQGSRRRLAVSPPRAWPMPLVDERRRRRGRGQLRDRLRAPRATCSWPSSRTSPRLSPRTQPADVDALMASKYPRQRPDRRWRACPRRSCPSVRTCKIRRFVRFDDEHQRGLCPRRRQDRRAGESGYRPGGVRRCHRGRQGRRHADRRAESPLLGQDPGHRGCSGRGEEDRSGADGYRSQDGLQARAGQGEDRHGQAEQVL